MKEKNWYEVIVKIKTEVREDEWKWVRKRYLIDAVSLTDLDVRVAELFKEGGQEFEVTNVAEKDYVEVLA